MSVAEQFQFVVPGYLLPYYARQYSLHVPSSHLCVIHISYCTAYANSMNSVASTAYELVNRKLFSLPKVLLLPAIIARQPMLVAQVFPFIMLSDWLKASTVSFMTTKIELLEKELQDVRAIRSKVEAFDMKNAELLQRSGIGATRFTQRRWEELTVKVQAKVVVSDLLARSKGFFSFIQRNFVFSVLVDCALADLIAVGMYLNCCVVVVYDQITP
jgi:hypothetical protein